MAKLEANLENLTNIVTEKFAEIGADVKAIVKEQNNARLSLVTREELEKNLNSFREDELKTIREEIRGFKKKRWVDNTLSAVFGAVLAILVAYFFTNIGR